MSITYKYTIVSVDRAARCMVVEYSAEGHETMQIGARLPFDGEDLESVIRYFAPVRYWEEQALSVVVPEVGQQGTLAPILPAEDTVQTMPTVPSGEIPQSVL